MGHVHDLVELFKAANLYGLPLMVWLVILGVGAFESELTPATSRE